MSTDTISNKGEQWLGFSAEVFDHVENYVVAQYGDHGDDPATEYNAEDCFKQAERYLKRRGSNSRPGQELRDVKKAVHWLQMAYDKLKESGLTDNIGK